MCVFTVLYRESFAQPFEFRESAQERVDSYPPLPARGERTEVRGQRVRDKNPNPNDQSPGKFQDFNLQKVGFILRGLVISVCLGFGFWDLRFSGESRVTSRFQS